MSIVSTAKGLIITGGLGGPACCSLLTANFGLVCGCVIEVVTPGSGGWAQYPVRNIPGVPQGSPYYTPAQRNYGAEQRIVNVIVRIGKTEWKRSYIVDKTVAGIIIKVSKLFNISKNAITVVVTGFKTIGVSMAKIKNIGVVASGLTPFRVVASGLKWVGLKVTAMFKNDDK